MGLGGPGPGVGPDRIDLGVGLVGSGPGVVSNRVGSGVMGQA